MRRSPRGLTPQPCHAPLTANAGRQTRSTRRRLRTAETASADAMTVEVKRRRHGLRRSKDSSSGKCQHSAKEKDGLYNTEIKGDLSIKDINMGSSLNTKRMQKTCLQIVMGNNDPYMLANLKASSEEVVLNIQIQGAQIVSLYLWHLSSSALYQNRLFLKTCSEMSNYGDTPLKSSSLLNVKLYKSVDICSTHKNYHPRFIIKDVHTFQQNLKTLKRLNAECDAEVCRLPKKNSVACQIQTFDSPPLPPPQNQAAFSVIHLEKHTPHACEMLSTSTDTCILKNIKQEKEEDGCLDLRQSDNGIVGCKRKTSHIKCPWRKQQHEKDEYMDTKEDKHSTLPCRSISMGRGNNSQKMQRFPHISGKNGMPSFVNSFHKSVKLDEEIIRKRSTEGGSAPEQLATETLFPHKACNPLAGLDPTSEHNNRRSLDTDFSTGRQEPHAAVEQIHLTSQLVSSKVTENIPLPNLAKQLADEDYQAYVDIIRKHGKLCEDLPDEDYRAYVGFFRKHGKLCEKLPDEDYQTYLEATTEHGVYKPSKDSHYKRTSCLMVDEDYVTFLKSIRVQGYSYVLDSRNGARCSVVTETNQNTDLRNKDYNFSLKNATVKGKSLKFERKPVIVSYAKNCSSLKTSERGNSPAKPKAAKRRQVDSPNKIILASNRGQTPFNVRRRSIRMSQLTEEQVSHSDLPLMHGVPRRDGQGMSSVDLGHMDMISTYPSSRYVSTEPNSFLIALRALLEKPYDKKEHRELMKKATYRKPVTRERNLRGNSKIYQSETMGLSYLDHYPEFHRKIKLANRPEQLNLLRGFFFWLQNPCSPHSFKPWTSFPQEQNMRLGSRRQL